MESSQGLCALPAPIPSIQARIAGVAPARQEFLEHTRPLTKPRQPVRFAPLWAAYPSSKPYLDPKTGDVPKGYENQCAIKVSVALAGVGEALSGYPGATVTVKGKRAAVRAAELAAWLRKTKIPGVSTPPETITGSDWQSRVKNRTGILFFADYWLRQGETAPTGDHIDLWNGSRLTASGLEGALVTIARFGLGIDSGPGFSDLGKAKTILFWEIK